MVRIGEISESIDVINFALENLPSGLYRVRVPRIVPAGEALSRVEAPRGELFYYVKSNGTAYPERVKVRTPTFSNIPSFPQIAEGGNVADVPVSLVSLDPCLHRQIRRLKMSLDLAFIFRVLIFPGFTFILSFTMFCDWAERKIEARMQNRIGPTYTGPSGILQPFADFIKLLTKEDVVPSSTKSVVFKVTPILSFSIFVFTLLFLPIDGANVIPHSSFEGDLIFVLAMVTVANFFLFLSGWSSTNPYSAIGATRVLTQFLGYDIPLFIFALTPAFLASDLSISTIAASQPVPFALLIPWAFVLCIVTLQAEFEKDPFDVPHAETEIVAGYETEYSGRRLAFLKLAKDVQIVLGAVIVVELFLSGPYGPVFLGLPTFWYTLWFILKVLFVIMITEYLTCIFTRLRIDQVLVINWRMLIPLSILSLVATVAVVFWLNPTVG